MVFFLAPEAGSGRNTENIDLIQLERKIQNGELKQLTIRERELVAVDRDGHEYRTEIKKGSSRDEILTQAREPDASGQPRVATIKEESEAPVPPGFPAAIVVLFGAHIVTIFLIMGLMPLYIILAVKNARLDETMRIIWVVLLCMVGFFAMPVYWYLNIWREPSASLGRTDVAPVPQESAS